MTQAPFALAAWLGITRGTMKKNRYPQTMEEAIQACLIKLPAETLEELAGLKEEDLWGCHFGLGLWIRNNLGLWKGAMNLMETFRHPDDVASDIVDALHAFLKKNPNWKEIQRQLIKAAKARKKPRKKKDSNP
jgi:hypothetical protein